MKLRKLLAPLLLLASFITACGTNQQDSELKRNAVPNDESIRIIKLYLGGFVYDWVMVTQGKGYLFACENLTALANLLTSTGYPEVLLNNAPVFQPDHPDVLELNITQQPMISCDSANGGMKTFYRSYLDGEYKYFFSDQDFSPYRLFMLGCQAMVDAMGFDINSAQDLESSLIDGLGLFTVDDEDDISCYSGSSIVSSLTWSPEDDVILDVIPGDDVFQGFSADFPDGNDAPLLAVMSSDCDWLEEEEVSGGLAFAGSVPEDFYGKECAVIVTAASGTTLEESKMLIITGPDYITVNSKDELRTVLDVLDPPENIKLGFADASNLYREVIQPIDPYFTKISLVHWDVSSVTDMNKMFYGAISFNQPIGNWNVSSVNDMSWMFLEASSFNQPIGIWNVSNVNDMSLMFSMADSFNQDIGAWNVSSVTDMYGMFERASSFNQNIGNWNVSSVSDMNGMFVDARSFNQPIGAWNVSNVNDMSLMFVDARSFNQSIGAWNVSSVANLSCMFLGASSFNQPIGAWNVSNVTDMSWMFLEASSFNQPIGAWNVSSVTNMEYMFFDASSFNQNLNSWTPTSLIYKDEIFTGSPLESSPPSWY